MSQRSSQSTPSSARRALTVGTVAGAGVVAGVWVGKRVQTFINEPRPDSMIDWERSRQIATNMNRGDSLTASERDELDAYYRGLVEACVPIVSAYTGTTLPEGERATFAFDRVDWVNANLVAFERMFDPIEELNPGKGRKNPVARVWNGVNQSVLSYEIGLLLGYMARRVLGQYDLALLGREPLSSGKLYYVEPNIRGIEAKLKLPREDFRMWLALHETTHAFEFEAHPWVRDHFNVMLDRYMDFLKQDADQLKQGMQGLRTIVSRAKSANGEGSSSWIEAFMNVEQRSLFAEMQAMMCVIEGYSNHVMNAVGRDLLKNYDLISRRFEERQGQRSQADQLFARLTGLDVKMEQYRAGEQFIDDVVVRKGHAFAHRVWDRAENLPTMDEIRHPGLWIDRIEAADSWAPATLTDNAVPAVD
ncbi:MAG: zinc-dependent metalloprotease [Thermomicrobiales bacterium]